MAFVIKDRVAETTVTTGTGTVTLLGAMLGFQSFGAIGNTNTTCYLILSGNQTDWEFGIGTYTLSGTTLSRTTILSSSNGGSAISLVGSSLVMCAMPSNITGANGLFNQLFGSPANGNYSLTVTGGVWTVTTATGGGGASGGGLWNQVMSATTPTQTNTGLTTSVNLGSMVVSDVATGVEFDGVAGALSDQIQGKSAAYTAPLTTVDLLIGWGSQIDGSFSNPSIYVEVGFTDGTKFVATRIFPNNGLPNIEVDHWTSSTGTIASVFNGGITGAGAAGPYPPFWFRIKDDNTNISFWQSADGVAWKQIYSEARGSFLTTGPNAWVFGCFTHQTNAKPIATILSYKKA